MKKSSICIIIAFFYHFQLQAVQVNNLTILLTSDSIRSKVKALDTFPIFDFGSNRYDINRQLEELQSDINNRVLILNNRSVDALAIALKRSQYIVADVLIGLFIEEEINMVDYRTGYELRSIYPQNTPLSEIIDCRLKFHEDYLEQNESIIQSQGLLLQSAIRSLRGMQIEIYSTNLPTPLLNRCDEIINTRIILNLLEWIVIMWPFIGI